MRTRSKLLLAGLTAALVLSVALSTASANRLSVAERGLKITWVIVEKESGAGTVRCPVTMEGSYHSSTIRKVQGALIGHLTRGTVAPAEACTGGSTTINQEALPWHVRYRGFRKTLPNIELDLEIIGFKATLEIGGVTCTTQTTVANPALGIMNVGAGGRVTGFTFDNNAQIPLRGNFFCGLAGNGRMRGVGTVTRLGSSSSTGLTLI